MSRRTYCTGFRSAEDYNSCCRQHDRAYGVVGVRKADGTLMTRAEADRELRDCVIQRGMPRPLAWACWLAVRLAGWAWWKRKEGT